MSKMDLRNLIQRKYGFAYSTQPLHARKQDETSKGHGGSAEYPLNGSLSNPPPDDPRLAHIRSLSLSCPRTGRSSTGDTFFATIRGCALLGTYVPCAIAPHHPSDFSTCEPSHPPASTTHTHQTARQPHSTGVPRS